MKQITKIAAIAGMAGVVATASVGCNDAEILATGVIVGAVVGAAVMDDDDGVHHRRRGPRRRSDRSRYERRRRGHYGHYPHHWHSVSSQGDLSTLQMQEQLFHSGSSDFTERMSEKFGISIASAQRARSLLTSLRRGEYESFHRIGFLQNDIDRVVNLKMPSKQAQATFAAAVKIQPNQSNIIFQTLIAEGEAQFEDIDSEVWDACMNTTGTWKTPQNTKCKSTSWNGCSPDTGATMCLPM